jgi:hypothetical protein
VFAYFWVKSYGVISLAWIAVPVILLAVSCYVGLRYFLHAKCPDCGGKLSQSGEEFYTYEC